MAEFAEGRIQEMIPEIEEMERIGLVTASEVKSLVQKRRDFEYKMARHKKEKSVYVNYVLFDCKLLDLLSLRRKKLRMREKSAAIERAISTRVLRRLRFMTRLWPSSLDLWTLRISFCKSRNFKEEVSSAYAEKVRFHSHLESVWIAWADWEIRFRENFHKARNLLLSRASLCHPNSIFISREYFRLELLFLEHLKNKSTSDDVEGMEEIISQNREKVLKCAIPEAIYNDAMNKLPSAEVALQFYNVAENFAFASNLKETIYTNLLTQSPRDKASWRLKTRRELGTMVEDEDGKMRPLKPHERLSKFLNLYNNAMEVVGHNFLSVYLEELVGLLYQSWGVDPLSDLLQNKIVELCKSYEDILSPLQFILWYSICAIDNSKDVDCHSIIDKAHSRHPSCSFTTHLYLKSILEQLNNDKSKIKAFEKLSSSFTGDLGVKSWMDLLHTLDSKDNIITMYEKAAHNIDNTVAINLRVEYIKHIFNKKGIKTTRKIYKKYRFDPPLSSAFHSSYIEKELKSKFRSVGDLRQAFDTAIMQFGSEQTGLWLSYISFERKYGDPARTSYLQNEAKDNLVPAKLTEFIDLKYVLDDQTEKVSASTSSKKVGRIFVNKSEDPEECEETPYGESCACKLFDENPMLTHKGDQTRKNLFRLVREFEKFSSGKKDKLARNPNLFWEPVLSMMMGEDISLSVKEVKSTSLVEDSTQEFLEGAETKIEDTLRKRKRNDDLLSDRLTIEGQTPSSKTDDKIAKILQTSETLQPEFMSQKQVLPYFLGRREKKMKKIDAQKPADAGKGWFNMKTPRMTEEIKRDMKLIEMRSVLGSSKTHYKRNDSKETPKFFQMGKIMDSPLDFYSSRVPKKQRKQTFAEELINDEKVVLFQKKKHYELMTAKEKRSKGFKMAKKEEKKNVNQKKGIKSSEKKFKKSRH